MRAVQHTQLNMGIPISRRPFDVMAELHEIASEVRPAEVQDFHECPPKL
jgi:hypothetical protein